MPAVSSFSFYPLSILTRRRDANTAQIIILLPKEHPGLGAASARRHRAFLCACGRDGRGERRRLRRVELGAGLSSKAAKAAAHLSRQRMKPSPILSQGPKQTWTSLTMRSRRLRSTTSSSTRFWPCRGLRAICEHGGGVAGVLNNGAVFCGW